MVDVMVHVAAGERSERPAVTPSRGSVSLLHALWLVRERLNLSP